MIKIYSSYAKDMHGFTIVVLRQAFMDLQKLVDTISRRIIK